MKLTGWVGGGSLTLLALLVFAFWAPLARRIRARRSMGDSLLLIAGKPKAVFTGYDRSGLSVQVIHDAIDASFAIGIQVRPDPRGYAGHAEVTA